jgi:hypothetical protein
MDIENTADVLKEKKEVILCECGSSITKKSFLRHQNSLKHKYFELKRNFDKVVGDVMFVVDNPLLEKIDL